jgi:multidrug efflux pump subunit AcrB
MSISEPFIRRPIATSLLMLGVLVFGIGAYGLLPVAALPKVDFPTIVVSVNYPGASPETMASAVATQLEQQFAIPGLAEMTSTSGIGSTAIVAIRLERNIDGAAGCADCDQCRDRGCAQGWGQRADVQKDQSSGWSRSDLRRPVQRDANLQG